MFETSFWLTALAWFLAVAPAPAHAAESVAPVHNVDGSFVREWLVLGPFPGRDLETDFLASVGGEANIRPKEGDTVTRSDGTQLTWTRLRSDYDIVSLEKVLGIQTWSVAYAYCELSSDRPMETNLRPATSSSPLWLNGIKVEPPPALSGGPSNVPVAYPIQLNAGPNPCLLKLGIGQWECVFSMQPLPFERATATVRVTDPHGQPIPGALLQFYDQGERIWQLRTGGTGQAEACLYPLAPIYDLRVTFEGAGAWFNDVALQSGERRDLNVVLSPAVSISGRALAMDGSPQNAIVVQALREPDSSSDLGRAALPRRPVARAEQQLSPTNGPTIPSLLPLPPFSETVLSDTNGNFRFVNLRPGAYRLRCHGPDGFVYPNGGQEAPSAPPLIVAPGRTNESVQFVFPEAKKGVWQNYRITKELIELSAVSIHRTPDGLLWVGTGNGTLHAYDGVDFKIFQAGEAPRSEVHVINHDAMGTVWIGTSGGMSRNGNGQFQPLPFNDSLPRKQVFGILTDPDGSVWFGTPSGLYRHGSGKLSSWTVSEGLPSNSAGPLIYARDGAVWVGTSTGLARFDGQSISVPLVFPFSFPLGVSKLHQAQDGAIWFCSTTWEIGGAFRLDGSALRRLGTEDGLLSEQVHDIAETSDGNLWFGTESGLSRFNGKTIVNYTMEDGLSYSSVRDIFVDEDDVLWLATGAGVSRFDPKHISRLTQKDGLRSGSGTPGVFAIESHPEGGFWVGTEWAGVFRIIPQESRPAVESVYPQLGYVRQIHRSEDGTLWFATASGLYQLLDGVPTQVLSREWLIALTSDDQGRLWYGNGWNGGGVSRYDPMTGQEVLFTRAHGLPDEHVWDLERSPGRGVWIGTGAGLALAEGETIEDAGVRLGLPAAAVRSIQCDADGMLRVSSSRGLYTSDGNKSVSITAATGLPDQQIWSSARTPDGIIWMASDSSGLIGYDGKATTVLDKRDGLPGNRVFISASDADGSLWSGFLDAGGLSRFQRSRSRPSVRLLQATVGDSTFTDSSSLPRTETGRLVMVSYQEIDLKTHPEKRQFYYRLVTASGATVFSGVTKERRFVWTPRKGGTYTFEVQSIDRDLNYSEPARLAYRAFVPWHANAWITVPGGGTLGGLLIWAFIARVIYLRQRREAERLREQMLLHERHARAALEEKTEQLEKAKKEADAANRAKSAFLANMSHEIRTPLNAILGYAQILRRRPNLPAEDRAAVKTIEASGDHLLTLINSVLDLSKIEAGSMEQQSADFDLAHLIREVAAMFQIRCQEKGLAWRVEFECGTLGVEADKELATENAKNTERGTYVVPPLGGHASNNPSDVDSPTPDRLKPGLRAFLGSLRSLRFTSGLTREPMAVHGDEGKLRQVLINLLGNAVKFTEAGHVVLRIEPSNQLSVISDQSPLITGHCLLITFSVIDTGPGIPVEAQEKLFAPFVQVSEGAKKGGTGLGLAISRRLVELMGGTIGLRSAPGQGAKFHFTVPFAPASERALEHAPLGLKEPSRLAAGFAVDALVVDDVEQNRQVLSEILSSLGCQVRLAESGPQALELIRLQAPDIVFTDIRMPGMSGLELRSEIVEEFGTNRMRIVAISASVLAHEQQRYLESGFDDFIGKPFRVAGVADCLARLLSVEFEYDVSSETQAASDPATADDLARVSLSAPLLARLRMAAKAYRIVEFNRCLTEVEQLGADGRRLAAALEALNQNGEKEKILAILDNLSH